MSFDCAAMHLYKLTCNGKPQAKPAMRPRESAISLAPEVKCPRQKLPIDPLAGIADRDLHVAADPLQSDSHTGPGGGEFYRVDQQVRHRLSEPLRGAGHRASIVFHYPPQPQATLVDGVFYHINCRADHLSHVDAAHVKPQLPAGDT